MLKKEEQLGGDSRHVSFSLFTYIQLHQYMRELIKDLDSTSEVWFNCLKPCFVYHIETEQQFR